MQTVLNIDQVTDMKSFLTCTLSFIHLVTSLYLFLSPICNFDLEVIGALLYKITRDILRTIQNFPSLPKSVSATQSLSSDRCNIQMI